MEIASGEGIFELRNATTTEEVSPDKDVSFIVTEANTEIVLNDAAFAGIEVSITALVEASITYDGTDGESHTDTIAADSKVVYIYTGSAWFLSSSAAPGPEPEPSTPTGYTYVVDSSEALNNWLHGVSGNDYTRVYITPGRHVIDYTALDQIKRMDSADIGTVTIEGAVGAVICDDDQADLYDTYNDYYLIRYTNRNKTGYIKNVTFDIRHYGPTVLVRNCDNITNCKFNALYGLALSSPTDLQRAETWCIEESDNVNNCICHYGYLSTAAVSNVGYKRVFSNCKNVIGCTVYVHGESDQTDPTSEDGEFCAFSDCIRVVNCTVYGIGDYIDYISLYPAIFSSCTQLINCVVIDIEYRNSVVAFNNCAQLQFCKGLTFKECYALFNCCYFNSSGDYGGGDVLYGAGAYFERCYMDMAEQYAVANTAEGGYNIVSTTSTGTLH